jgi:hypothetical protein
MGKLKGEMRHTGPYGQRKPLLVWPWWSPGTPNERARNRTWHHHFKKTAAGQGERELSESDVAVAHATTTVRQAKGRATD